MMGRILFQENTHLVVSVAQPEELPCGDGLTKSEVDALQTSAPRL